MIKQQEKSENISFGRKIFLKFCQTLCERSDLLRVHVCHDNTSLFWLHFFNDLYCCKLGQNSKPCCCLFRWHDFISLNNMLDFFILNLLQLLQDSFNLLQQVCIFLYSLIKIFPEDLESFLFFQEGSFFFLYFFLFFLDKGNHIILGIGCDGKEQTEYRQYSTEQAEEISCTRLTALGFS